MLTARINIHQIDDKRSFTELFPLMLTKLEKTERKNTTVRLLRKMGKDSLTIALGMLEQLDEETKRELFCSVFHLYGQDISAKINETLSRHELGKNIQISGLSLLEEGENLVLLARRVSVNYSGLLENTDIQQKISRVAGRKVQGLGGLFQQFAENNAGFLIKTAVSMLPEETEKMALSVLQKMENNQQMIDLVEKSLQQKGIWMKLSDIQFLYVENTDEERVAEEAHLKEPETRPWISEELEEKLLDAVVKYVRGLLKKE